MTNFQQELRDIFKTAHFTDRDTGEQVHIYLGDKAAQKITTLFLQTIEQSKGKKSGIWAQESWLKGYEEGQHQLHQNIVKNVGGSDE